MNLNRDIIIDNYQNPINRGLEHRENYEKINANNETCIDNFDFEILIGNEIIKDIRFDGEGCAISTAASSMMIKLLLNKTKKEALNIIENYENMINGKEYNEETLKEATSLNEIYKQPARKKCALLPFLTIKGYIQK